MKRSGIKKLTRVFSNGGKQDFSDFEKVSKGDQERGVEMFFKERRKFHQEMVKNNPNCPKMLFFYYCSLTFPVGTLLMPAYMLSIINPLALAYPILMHVSNKSQFFQKSKFELKIQIELTKSSQGWWWPLEHLRLT